MGDDEVDLSFELDSDDDDRIEERLRYRPGNRFVPSFHDLVDKKIRFVFFDCLTGETRWSCERDERSDTVVVEVSYRDGFVDDTCSTVWDSAVVLSRYVVAHRNDSLKRFELVVELGSGTGLAGLVAASVLNVPVVLTDLPENLHVLQRSVVLNQKATVQVEPLSWGDEAAARRIIHKSPLLVCCADCLLPYGEALMQPLVHTIAALMQHDDDLTLLAYEKRFDVSVFFSKLLPQSGLCWRQVQSLDRDSLIVVEIYRMKR